MKKRQVGHQLFELLDTPELIQIFNIAKWVVTLLLLPYKRELVYHDIGTRHI